MYPFTRESRARGIRLIGKVPPDVLTSNRPDIREEAEISVGQPCHRLIVHDTFAEQRAAGARQQQVEPSSRALRPGCVVHVTLTSTMPI